MQYIEAISLETAKFPSVFLAGGISNCPNWQNEISQMIENFNITVFNPRRENFPIDDQNQSEIQIYWEFERLRQSDIILFWFSEGSLNPISLFEFGAALERNQKIFVGIHQNYQRKLDVEIQTKLIKPEIKIFYSINDLGNELKRYLSTWCYL